jgi:hypothetical protein
VVKSLADEGRIRRVVRVAVAPSRCTIIRAVAECNTAAFLRIGGIYPHKKDAIGNRGGGGGEGGGGGAVLDIFSSVGGRVILLVRIAVFPPLQSE